METFILNRVSALCWMPLVVLITVLEITITFYYNYYFILSLNIFQLYNNDS